MKRSISIIYGSGASYASGYKVNVKYFYNKDDRSKVFKPPTDKNFFNDIPFEYIKIKYGALFYFIKNYYSSMTGISMENVWTDIDINHKHITLDTHNWKNKGDIYLSGSVTKYPYMDINDDLFDAPYFNTSPTYNRYKFLGDCGRDFRHLVYDIYADYEKPTEDDLLILTHKSITSNSRNLISYITFNYDCYLEQSLVGENLKYVALNDRTDRYDSLIYNGIPIIKLHGSMNWSEICDNNIYKVIYNPFPYSKGSQVEPKYVRKKEWVQPAIIPPTIFKQEINDDSRLTPSQKVAL